MPRDRITGLTVPAQELSWHAVKQGKLIQISENWNWRQAPTDIKRGIVGPFSRASRLRMLKEIARIDWPKVGPSVLITLTYPDALAGRTYAERTQDKYLFHRYIEKHVGKNVGVLWRVEWKDRLSGEHEGIWVPHIHMVACDVTFIHWQTVRAWWRRILNWKGPLATDIRRASTGAGAAIYASKYAAKLTPSSLDNAAYLNSNLGRAWGVMRKGALPYAPAAHAWDLDADTVDLLRTWAHENLANYDRDCGGSFTILGDQVGNVGALIRRWILDEVHEQ